MKNILLIGAGKSASVLINYLLAHAQADDYILTVADLTLAGAIEKTKSHKFSKAVVLDATNETDRKKLIASSDIVISMLPAFMHFPVAQDCVTLGKNLVTASYVSAAIKTLDEEAKTKGVLLLNEIGLDPGIDHMSAMHIIDKIKAEGGIISSFKSYCGGLVAPESNDNPWGYKFSWNPRNVILAGQGTAQYIQNGVYKYLPYHRLYSEMDEINVTGLGNFDAYANRDSLSYRSIYGLDHIPTLVRGTLRQQGFCHAWNIFVQLGITDDSYTLELPQGYTYGQFIESFLPAGKESLKAKISALLKIPPTANSISMVEWTGILSDLQIGLTQATPAQVLQKLLEMKWELKAHDLDMIVMQHLFEYQINQTKYALTSSLVCKGSNQVLTAMAKTVGLPVAMAARNILKGKITLTGVQVPVMPEIYELILAELALNEIVFEEHIVEI